MLKSVTTVLITLFFLSFNYSQSSKIYGSFESNAVYYQENEEENYENKLGSNNWSHFAISLFRALRLGKLIYPVECLPISYGGSVNIKSTELSSIKG